MKIKVLMALAVLPLLAFECCDDTDTWQFRCQRGSEFTLYPQDVLDEVIGESLMSLNFVQSVIDSHNGNPSLGIHSVKDGTGWEYLVENRIEKSDTIWFDARRRMRMRRSQPGNKWIVTRKDDYGYNDQLYSFELKAERCDKDVDGALKYPWLVTVEGQPYRGLGLFNDLFSAGSNESQMGQHAYFQQRRYHAGRQTAHLFLQGRQENRLDKC